MIKILFLIHDLGQGGAEKVLVNLVNHMDRTKFDISVTVLFGGGINERFLAPDIHFRAVFPKSIPANSKLMKLLTPEQLHRLCVRDTYDIEVSYLEGPAARIISGCTDKNTKLLCWIHCCFASMDQISAPFRSREEAVQCYDRFHQIVAVSQWTKDHFCKWIPIRKKCSVLYNTVESEKILTKSKEAVTEIVDDGSIRLIAVGSLKEVKGFDRLLRIVKRMKDEGDKIHLYLLGRGPLRHELDRYIRQNALQDVVTMLGYQLNPYKYVAKCDMFVCSSYSEGFSTAATEALIVGTPVCTVEVSGMKEMLGEHDEYGVVTENDENSLYQGIKKLINEPELLEHYKKQAKIRGKNFNTEQTVQNVERLFHLVLTGK